MDVMQTFEEEVPSKAVVSPETKKFLGDSLEKLQAKSSNQIAMCMDSRSLNNITKQIFTHPAMAENLNDLFAI